MTPLNQLEEWQALRAHQKALEHQTMLTWFAENPSRFTQFSLEVSGILLDYSKNRITSETLSLLSNLAHAVKLPERIQDLFAGNPLNLTENRPALHTALRNRSHEAVYVNGENVMPDIQATLHRMQQLTELVRSQQWLGVTGKPITDIVNIGIGGSHLGPEMAVHALSHFGSENLRCHFISNIDSVHLQDIFKQVNPETTLFIVSSKSFTTLETMTNAQTVRAWLQQSLGTTNLNPHFIAITSAPNKAAEFGIPAEQIFPMWDWVGGRYSVWSAIGLPLALMIGMDRFIEFLEGAHEMDEHFKQAEFSANMPVIMALLGIWYINFFEAKSHAIVPYAHQLHYFRSHLQQLDMESNGKSAALHGAAIDYTTGPVIWGENGCNGQHAFHQLLHQGQHFIPVDFILVGKNRSNIGDHQDILIASALSQAQALLHGKTPQQALEELKSNNLSDAEASFLAAHKFIPGNRPSNVLFMNEITPHNLGALLALYEHKIFVQGVIWNINSFDQWGVELGKQLLPQILQDFTALQPTQHDASTSGLIQHYKKLKETTDSH